VTVRAFSDERKARWAELGRLLTDAKRPQRLGADGVRRLGALYRASAADLALARRLFPGDPVVAELEQLVGRARQAVYSAATRRPSLRRFVTTDYWRLVVERPVLLLVAAACLFLPAVLAGSWALRDPGAAGGLVPGEYRSVTEPRSGTDLGLTDDEMAAFAGEIFTNNIRVALMTFAAGVLLGIGSAVVLALNGVLLGVVAGLAVGAGNGEPFFELVAPHGVLELSCIVVAGVAGLRLGWSIVEPGTETRRSSVAREARSSVLLAVGTAPWLVLAGIVEGYVTPGGYGLGAALAVGVALGALYWGLVVWRGLGGRAAASEPGAGLGA
jgi:uncharacterized membrane protein SpoIIM required for sporulation